MKNKMNYSFLNPAKNMPALFHKLPNADFEVGKSEVIAWLIDQDEIKQKIFNMAVNHGAIKYDSETKKWRGVNYED